MNGRQKRSLLRRAGGLFVLGIAAGALFLAQHRRTRAYGNHLYRAGQIERAAEVYGSAIGEAAPAPVDAFNLGTALVLMEPDSAGLLLERSAGEADDPELVQRALYNFGYHLFFAAHRGLEPDSSYALLSRAVEVDRLALRLDPTDDDARWNLAIAQRALDAMTPPGRNTGRESTGESDDEVAMNDPALARSESATAESGPEPEENREVSNTGERLGGQRGAQEAWATQDPGPISPQRASELLSTVVDDPETLLRGILWSHRPDVAWWAGQPYPGGSW